MQLAHFKTLWGHEGPPEEAITLAQEAGFQGIEAPCPADAAERDRFGRLLSDNNLQWIQEVCTAGSYVPRRDATLQEHLADFEQQLVAGKAIGARFLNVMGGCDAWPIQDSVAFFAEANNIALKHGVLASFETHRGRSFFSPWNTVAILEQLPDLAVTCDFSHWAVVCERLPDIEWDAVTRVASQAHHIHSRVGYDQGPQVPHPGAPEYQDALQAHQRCWEAVWESQRARGMDVTTMTPEFGTDGYLHLLPYTQAPVADLWSVNRWIAECEMAHFENWNAANKQG